VEKHSLITHSNQRATHSLLRQIVADKTTVSRAAANGPQSAEPPNTGRSQQGRRKQHGLNPVPLAPLALERSQQERSLALGLGT
jgi:hypothetical protein